MCYDNNARPPELPHGFGGGGTAIGEDITLTAADGTKFMAYVARAAQATGAQILIYPDIRGLHPFYKELALRFAEAGLTAVAMDYFGRSAGLAARTDDFDWQTHVGAMTWPTFTQDVRSSVAHLRTLAPNPRPIFTVGFCMGGGLCLYSSMADLGLTGVIGFYAGMRRAWGEEYGSLPDAGRHAKIPVLGLFGGNDPGIPPEQVQALDERLDESGVAHAIHSYAGAPHSFFDRKFDEYKSECEDAWKRVFEFVSKHTGG